MNPLLQELREQRSECLRELRRCELRIRRYKQKVVGCGAVFQHLQKRLGEARAALEQAQTALRDGELLLGAVPKDHYSLREMFAFERYYKEQNEASMEVLAKEILIGGISVTRITLPKLLEPHEFDQYLLDRFSGRTIRHKVLCARAAAWLVDRNLWWKDGNILYYPGGTADVLSSDEKIAVECGTTQAQKVLRACARGVSVLVVPYLDCDDTIGFFFEPLDELGVHRRYVQKPLDEYRRTWCRRTADEIKD